MEIDNLKSKINEISPDKIIISNWYKEYTGWSSFVKIYLETTYSVYDLHHYFSHLKNQNFKILRFYEFRNKLCLEVETCSENWYYISKQYLIKSFGFK